MSNTSDLAPTDKAKNLEKLTILLENSLEKDEKNESKNLLSQLRTKIKEIFVDCQGYEKISEKMNNKIQELLEKIKELNEKNRMLEEEIQEIKVKFSIKIQEKQAKFEEKSRNSKENIDLLLRDLNCKSVLVISQKLHYECERYKHKTKSKCEKKISQIVNDYEKQLQRKENDHQTELKNLQSYNSAKLKRAIEATEKILKPPLNNLTTALQTSNSKNILNSIL
ncbi:hypothetical protein SteCoe_28582 [Stentor coeruleus]|uniref:Uncharacterized protein n=1 Tax=Stentor coeruleus TaxID=5963 RepID=A0A1R2B7X2_9CILI|nr:hypothetical protein SteCoe_28582 [Stentor coeruleus]